MDPRIKLFIKSLIMGDVPISLGDFLKDSDFFIDSSGIDVNDSLRSNREVFNSDVTKYWNDFSLSFENGGDCNGKQSN